MNATIQEQIVQLLDDAVAIQTDEVINPLYLYEKSIRQIGDGCVGDLPALAKHLHAVADGLDRVSMAAAKQRGTVNAAIIIQPDTKVVHLTEEVY